MTGTRRPPAGLRIGVLVLAAAGSAGTSFAQAPPATIDQCRGIVANGERLACYDALAGRAGDARRDPAQAVATESARTDNGVTTAVRLSMIDEAWGFDPASAPYEIRFHRANYLLFGRYSDNVNSAPFSPFFQGGMEQNDLSSTEAKFQFSFKARLWTTDDRRWGVWAAYTQQSQWQLYNGDVSRAFRDTNYMPELFVSYKPAIDLGGGFSWNLLSAGFNHQSNGRSDALSRNWNRLFAEVGVERDSLALSGKLWYRLPEDAGTDDNPDITDYYGHGEFSTLYRWRGNSFAAMARGNLSTGKGAVQFGWFSPPVLGPLRGYVQVFSGYGETLIDYNWKQNTIGIGIALSDGF